MKYQQDLTDFLMMWSVIMQRKLIKNLSFVAIFFFIVGCASVKPIIPIVERTVYAPSVLETEQSFVNSPVSPIIQAQPTVFPNPKYGQAAVYGSLISSMTQIPIAETAVYLTRGIGENSDLLPPILIGPLDNDIIGFTDKQGNYMFSDVLPGIYYLIIWSPVNWVPLSNAVTNPNEPLQLVLKENQALDNGEIIVNWP